MCKANAVPDTRCCLLIAKTLSLYQCIADVICDKAALARVRHAGC